MSPLLVKILIAIIGKLGVEMILIALKELAKEYQAHRASLTPEQREEWNRDWKEDFRSSE